MSINLQISFLKKKDSTIVVMTFFNEKEIFNEIKSFIVNNMKFISKEPLHSIEVNGEKQLYDGIMLMYEDINGEAKLVIRDSNELCIDSNGRMLKVITPHNIREAMKYSKEASLVISLATANILSNSQPRLEQIIVKGIKDIQFLT